jgi:hypothetical protein
MIWYAPVHTFNPSRQSYYMSLQLCNPFCSNPFNYLHCFRHCWSGTRHYWGSVGHFDPGFLFRVQAFRSDLSWPSNDYVHRPYGWAEWFFPEYFTSGYSITGGSGYSTRYRLVATRCTRSTTTAFGSRILERRSAFIGGGTRLEEIGN